ncbi:hypothetical protein ES703_13460 [subsurface metagenome]
MSLARTHYQLELYDQTREYYQKLKLTEPELAGRFAYLVVRTKEEQRASAVGTRWEEVLWEED